MRFKSFLLEQNIGDVKPNNESKSIVHIEDMPIDDFIECIENIHNMVVSDKLDGVALRVGVDINGNFYTTRAGKGNPKKIYTHNNYPLTGAGNIFAMGHLVLESQKDTIMSIMSPGDAVDVEILYGRQPNAVIYGANNKNFLAFLRTAQGDGPQLLNYNLPITLAHNLFGKTPKIKFSRLESLDGINIISRPEITEWEFVIPVEMESTDLKNLNLNDNIKSLKEYLDKPNKIATRHGYMFTNKDMLNISLSNIESVSKDAMKKEKEFVQEDVKFNYILPMKNIILDEYVRKFKSPLQDSLTPEENFGYEGLVFFDKKTGKSFKVVDREVFTEINNFNHSVRRQIRGPIMTIDQEAPLKSRGGVYGNALIRIMQLFSIDGLALPRNTKKIIKKFKGKNGASTVNNLADTMIHSNFESMKKKSIAIIDSTIEDLENAVEKFKKNAYGYKLNLSSGKTIGYSKEIISRTLLSFAEARRDLLSLRHKLTAGMNIKDFIITLLGNKIKQVHGVEV